MYPLQPRTPRPTPADPTPHRALPVARAVPLVPSGAEGTRAGPGLPLLGDAMHEGRYLMEACLPLPALPIISKSRAAGARPCCQRWLEPSPCPGRFGSGCTCRCGGAAAAHVDFTNVRRFWVNVKWTGHYFSDTEKNQGGVSQTLRILGHAGKGRRRPRAARLRCRAPFHRPGGFAWRGSCRAPFHRLHPPHNPRGGCRQPDRQPPPPPPPHPPPLPRRATPHAS